MSRMLLLLLALLLLSACSSTPSLDPQALQHHHWELSTLDGEPVISNRDNRPDLEIGEHFTVNGIAGCNRYFGQGNLDEDRFWVSSLGNTAMACPPPLDRVEQAVLTTLAQGAILHGTPAALVLQGQRHRLEYRLRDWMH